jgi:cytochrome c oxidase cbb3-type subunit 3
MARLPTRSSTARLVVSVVGAAGLALTCRQTPPAPLAVHTPEPDGRALYTRYCSLCHGASGEGYRADHASALSNQDFLASASDGFLRVAITRGRPGTNMSAWGKAFGGPLTDRDIEALVARLREWQHVPRVDLDRAPVRGDPSRAAPIFAARCASCHGTQGQGRYAVSLNNPVFLATATDAYLRHAIARGRRDTKMKPFDSRLSPTEIDDLVALIRSWADRPPTRSVAHSGLSAAGPRGAGPILYPDGSSPEFSLREGKYVSARQLLAALEQRRRLVLVDARTPADYARGHIPGAVNVPFFDADQAATRLPDDGTWIVAYCGCPHAESGVVMRALRAHGYRHTATLDEGVFYWQDHGYPMVGSVR